VVHLGAPVGDLLGQVDEFLLQAGGLFLFHGVELGRKGRRERLAPLGHPWEAEGEFLLPDGQLALEEAVELGLDLLHLGGAGLQFAALFVEIAVEFGDGHLGIALV
jgi:hypothetical protein